MLERSEAAKKASAKEVNYTVSPGRSGKYISSGVLTLEFMLTNRGQVAAYNVTKEI